jgi:hypothetical protein
MTRPPTLALLSLALLAFTTTARAEPQTGADAHFRAGRDAAKRGDFATACAELRESQKLDPAAGTLLNLGDCEEHLGHAARAYQLFGEAKRELPANDPRAKIAEERAAAVEARIARLTVVLAPGAPAGARVKRDGVDVTLGSPVVVDPGSYVLEVVAPGRSARRTPIELRAGDTREVLVEAGPAETPLASAPAVAGQASDSRRTLGWIVGGAGVAALAAGVVTGVLVGVEASTYKDHCPGNACDAQGLDASSAGKTLQVMSPIALAVGAACTGIGAYLLFSSPSRATQAAVAPAPGGGAVVLRRSF